LIKEPHHQEGQSVFNLPVPTGPVPIIGAGNKDEQGFDSFERSEV
jgi:hypothetical protein